MPALVLHVGGCEARQDARTACLRNAGFCVVDVESPDHLFNLFARQRPDLILMDDDFASPSSAEIRQALEAATETRAIPLLLISRTDSRQEPASLQLRSSAFLVEPVDPRVLLATVTFLLHSHVQASATNISLNSTPEVLHSEACIATDRDFRITHVNRDAERLLEISAPGILGKSLWEIDPALSEDSLQQQCGRAMRDCLVVSIEYHDQRRDRWLDVKACPTRSGGLALFFRDISDLKRAERALTDIQRRWTRLIDASIIGIATADEEGVRYANDEFLRIAGLTREDLVTGKADWKKVTAPEHLPRDLNAMEELRRCGKCVPFEKDFVHPDGTRVPVLVGAATLATEPLEWVAFIIDITSRKETEEALRISRQRLEVATEGAGFATWDLNLLTGEAVWSARLFELLGYKPAPGGRANKEMWRSCVHPDHAARNIAAFEKARLERSVYAQDYRIIRVDDGRILWLSVFGRFQYDAKGDAVRLTGVVFDSTERKQAEQALRESEDRFRTLADNIAQFAWMSDEAGSRFWFNRRWYEYTGTTLEEMQGWGWQKTHHPDHVGRVVAHMKHCFMAGHEWEDKYPLRGKDGVYRWFLSRALPIRNAAGHIFRWFGTDTDITGQLESEERVQEALADTQHALEALHLSEERLRLAQESAGCATWEWDSVTDELVCSPEYYELFGCASGSLSSGQDWLQFLIPDDRERVLNDWKLVPLGGELRTEFRIVRRGEVRWFLSGGRMCPERNGHILGVAIDITARKKIEEALAQSREVALRRLREIEAIYATAPVGLCFVDMELRFVSVNERLAKMNGLPASDHIGRTVAEVTPGIGAVAESMLRQALSSGQPMLGVEIQEHSPLPAREPRTWICSYYPLKEADGRVRGINAVVEDISERKRIEEALRESETRYRLVASATNDAIWDYDLVTGRVQWTDAIQTLFGYSQDGIAPTVGWWAERIHPDDQASVAATLDAITASSNADKLAIEYRFRRADGSYAHVLDRGFVLRRDNKPVRMVGSMLDLTPIREVEEQLRLANTALERSNEELQRFAYAVSHDLRSPLRTIGSLTELFANKYGSAAGEEGRQVLQMVVGGVNRMSKLITDLLEYSRLTAHTVPSGGPVDCNALFAWAVMNLQQRIQETGAVVTSDKLPTVLADDQLLRVFQNLIENGIKYRGELRPVVHVSAQKRGEFWLISVRDNGIGFEMEHADRIFAVFHRLHSPDRYEGSGIGLAICRRIIECIGGRIWVDSKPGVGSTFYFTVPAVHQAEAERAASGPG